MPTPEAQALLKYLLFVDGLMALMLNGSLAKITRFYLLDTLMREVANDGEYLLQVGHILASSSWRGDKLLKQIGQVIAPEAPTLSALLLGIEVPLFRAKLPSPQILESPEELCLLGAQNPVLLFTD